MPDVSTACLIWDCQAQPDLLADALGLGPEYNTHSCLGYILQELPNYPGHGVGLIRIALKSPVISNRNAALRVLSQWGKEKWPAGMDATLQETLAAEPEEKVKEFIKDVIAGKKIEF